MKTDNKADIEAWVKENNIKKLKVGICKGATVNGSICAGGFSARALARSSARANWVKDNPKKSKNKRSKNKARKLAKYKEKEEVRKLRIKFKKAKKEYLLEFKADLLNEILNNQMIRAMEKDL